MSTVDGAVGRGHPVEPLPPAGAAGIIVYRNYLSYRAGWYILISGFHRRHIGGCNDELEDIVALIQRH